MSSIYHGEKRWPGADGAISRDDYIFCTKFETGTRMAQRCQYMTAEVRAIRNAGGHWIIQE